MTAPSNPADAHASNLTSRALRPFGTTIFTTMTRLAQQHNAVNLSQGFPDYDGPSFIKDAAKHALDTEHNQYAPMPGIPALRKAIADRFTRDSALPCDPDTNVVVTSGCTEAIAAAMFGLLNPGDEVVLFEPFYDSYRACVAMAGCTARFVALRAPKPSPGHIVDQPFSFDPDQLQGAITPRTRMILINTPHNPTGKVFSREELTLIAQLCMKHNLIALCDEVYERLLLSDEPHINLASMPGMSERTLTLSSIGKTFSFTGWKIGWAVGPANLVAAARSAHQFLTFAVVTPLQHAAAVALRDEDRCVRPLVAELKANRDKLAAALASLGFSVYQPHGTCFIMADHSSVSTKLNAKDDQEFCLKLIERVGVAAIPPSVFYNSPELGKPLVRFAFCKKPTTIDEGISRLQALRSM